jgi:hypothetical protein
MFWDFLRKTKPAEQPASQPVSLEATNVTLWNDLDEVSQEFGGTRREGRENSVFADVLMGELDKLVEDFDPNVGFELHELEMLRERVAAFQDPDSE